MLERRNREVDLANSTAVATIASQHSQIGRGSREDRVPAREGEASWRDANDGVRLGVQREDTAENLRIGTETSAPQRVAHYRDVI